MSKKTDKAEQEARQRARESVQEELKTAFAIDGDLHPEVITNIDRAIVMNEKLSGPGMIAAILSGMVNIPLPETEETTVSEESSS